MLDRIPKLPQPAANSRHVDQHPKRISNISRSSIQSCLFHVALFRHEQKLLGACLYLSPRALKARPTLPGPDPWSVWNAAKLLVPRGIREHLEDYLQWLSERLRHPFPFPSSASTQPHLSIHDVFKFGACQRDSGSSGNGKLSVAWLLSPRYPLLRVRLHPQTLHPERHVQSCRFRRDPHPRVGGWNYCLPYLQGATTMHGVYPEQVHIWD